MNRYTLTIVAMSLLSPALAGANGGSAPAVPQPIWSHGKPTVQRSMAERQAHRDAVAVSVALQEAFHGQDQHPLREALTTYHQHVSEAHELPLVERNGTALVFSGGAIRRRGGAEATLDDLQRVGITKAEEVHAVLRDRLREELKIGSADDAGLVAATQARVNAAHEQLASWMTHADFQHLIAHHRRSTHDNLVAPGMIDLPLGGDVEYGIQAHAKGSAHELWKQLGPTAKREHVTLGDLKREGIRSEKDWEALLGKTLLRVAGLPTAQVDAAAVAQAREVLKEQITDRRRLEQWVGNTPQWLPAASSRSQSLLHPSLQLLYKSLVTPNGGRGLLLADDGRGNKLEVGVGGFVLTRAPAHSRDKGSPFHGIDLPGLHQFGIDDMTSMEELMDAALAAAVPAHSGTAP